MASNINPNTIDTGYPIAGQDNDSQGFRDNFTNIRTNFDNTRSEIEDLQNNIFYFIKNLDETSVNASTFYMQVMGDLQDIAQSVGFISKVSHKHINNNHKGLKVNQSKELKQIDKELCALFTKTRAAFDLRAFDQISGLLEEKQTLLKTVSEFAQVQVERTRTTESSPKNTTLYFSILLETEDLIKATISLLELYAAKK